VKIFIYMGMALGLAAAPPSITELQPRGAQKGRPFTLTIAGQNLGEGARIVSAMPATFTPMAPPAGMAEGRSHHMPFERSEKDSQQLQANAAAATNGTTVTGNDSLKSPPAGV
jgi:hypothetical protein